MKLCQLPAPLQPGDLLHVIAPSGTLREFDALEQGLAVWQQRGYRLALVPGYADRWGYLAGRDAQRRIQLETALSDPTSRGILCVRGGWGGARLLEKWVFPPAEAKWLIGFSDITSLLWAYAQQGVSGVHGPLLTTIAAEPIASQNRLFDWLEGRDLDPLTGVGWGGGQGTGLLLPANLTVATHLLQTPWQLDFSGVVLAIEDVGEAPYRLDRMLTQWRLSGALQSIAGIAIGRFSQCEVPSHLPSFTVQEVLRERLTDLGVPIVANLPFGHDGENAALPVGRPVILDGDRGTLQFSADSSGSDQ